MNDVAYANYAVLLPLGEDDVEAQSRRRAFKHGLRDVDWVEGHDSSASVAPVCIAFRLRNGVSTRDMNLCGAQWLAYVLLCRRFAAALAGDSARLEVDVDRHSFIVSDSRRLLIAGLPAHCERFWTLPRGVLCGDRTRVCGIPSTRAQTSNLQACGGCDMRLAQRIGAELATTKVVPYASMAWEYTVVSDPVLPSPMRWHQLAVS